MTWDWIQVSRTIDKHSTHLYPDLIYISLGVKSLSLDFVDHCSNSLGNNTILPVTLSSLVVSKKNFITRF